MAKKSYPLKLPASVKASAERLQVDEVRIRRLGQAVILEPASNDWDWLAEITGPVDADFEAAATERASAQERGELDDAFK